VLQVAEYDYNGLNQRIVKRWDTNPFDATNLYDKQTLFYYDASWRILEEHTDEDTTELEMDPTDTICQNVWGLRYIDDIVLRRWDRNVDGDYVDAGEGSFYHLTDVQFSTVAMLDEAGGLKERVAYDPFGKAHHQPFHDVDGDGG